MWKGKVIAVAIPAYEEERLLPRVIRYIPPWVDSVIVVDDASRDSTAAVARREDDPRVTVVRHATNRGVGAAIVTGYYRALAAGADVVAVMAGDDQMDPGDLARLVEPVASGSADYCKGNRFLHPERRRMPVLRRAAGRLLAAATRATTGLAIDDSQCGYTALAASAAARLPLSDLWPRYGYPNDLLALLADANLRVVEVPVRPVYGDERSGVRPWHVLTILGILARRRWPRSRKRGASAEEA
jgi:glycosyltransferase involved in cell wall biosynthesis